MEPVNVTQGSAWQFKLPVDAYYGSGSLVIISPRPLVADLNDMVAAVGNKPTRSVSPLRVTFHITRDAVHDRNFSRRSGGLGKSGECDAQGLLAHD